MKSGPVKIAAIVAMSENRVIGRDNRLPWHLPADLKRFKSLTMGKPVIMGRNTFESIGKPLPGRTNIVLSRRGFEAEGVRVFRTLDEALAEAHLVAEKDGKDEIMIIGGEQIFREALPLTDRIYLSVVHETIEGDAFFPELNEDGWLAGGDEAFPATDGQPTWSFRVLDRQPAGSS